MALEPAGRWLTGHLGVLIGPMYPAASAAEVIVGLALTTAVAIGIARSRTARA